MAAPELRNTTPFAGESAEPAANPETPPPAMSPAADDDSRWFEDFERVEKVFYFLAPFMFVSALVAYVGLHLEIYPVFIVAVVILGVTMVGMSGLIMPLGWAFLKGFRHWRRQRAAGGGRGKDGPVG